MDRPNKPAAILSPLTKAPQPVVNVQDDRVIARLPTGESVEILLFGATVISWKSANGTENLWLSKAAKLDGSKPVRGGIPVVFPVSELLPPLSSSLPFLTCGQKVFGPPPKNHTTSSLPQHGFARSVRWEFLGKSTSESESSQTKAGPADDGVTLDFGLYSSAIPENFRKAWPYDFGLVYSVTLSRAGLRTMVNVRNEGREPFEFQVLMHTYLGVNVRSFPFFTHRLEALGEYQLTVLIGCHKSPSQWPRKCDIYRQSSRRHDASTKHSFTFGNR